MAKKQFKSLFIEFATALQRAQGRHLSETSVRTFQIVRILAVVCDYKELEEEKRPHNTLLEPHCSNHARGPSFRSTPLRIIMKAGKSMQFLIRSHCCGSGVKLSLFAAKIPRTPGKNNKASWQKLSGKESYFESGTKLPTCPMSQLDLPPSSSGLSSFLPHCGRPQREGRIQD